MKNTFNWLSPDHQIFIYAAQLGSISAVARKIGKDVGNLSRAITRLENLQGEPLFIRRQSGLKLTSAGEMLYQSLIKASEAFHQTIHPQKNIIRIGFSPSVGFGFMGHFFPLLSRLNFAPQFTFAPSIELYELLKKREIDFVLSPRSPKFPGVVSSPMFATKLCLCSRHGRITSKLIRSEMLFELAERLKNINFEETLIINDDFILAKLLAASDDYMGIVPECILSNFPELKIINHQFKDEKVFAITWKGSNGIELLKAGKQRLSK